MVGPEVGGGVKIERRRDGRLVGGGGGVRPQTVNCRVRGLRWLYI